MISLCLLRAPPFHGCTVTLSEPATVADPPPPDLMQLLREARVGGKFWLPPAQLAAPASAILRPRAGDALDDMQALIPTDEQAGMIWSASDGPSRPTRCGQWIGDVDPWSVLENAGQLIAHGNDEWVAIARLCAVPVQVLSAGRYGTPADTPADLDSKALQAISAARYTDPFTGQPATIAQTIALLAEWRRLIASNRSISAACGMAWWKRDEIRRFLWVPGQTLHIVSRATKALKIARRAGGAVAIWPSRVSPTLLAEAASQGTPLVRVEDGFVRSVGLGSNLVPPSSVVVDRRGIHFDPSSPSDLEHILATNTFTPALIDRAGALRQTILASGISKYSVGTGSTVPLRTPGRRIVLVPAQVEDDMSVIAGGGGLQSNLELLRRARALEPDAEIWFRPHPDVDAGHRKGAVADEDVLQIADRIVRGGGMATLLDAVDAVHVNTSLTGFEALMRGLEVTCHGTPFYAGWGLTRDLGTVPDRRGRRLALDELVAGVLILYPRYLDPVSGLPCPPEVLIQRMSAAHTPNRLGWVEPLRRLQGRFMAHWR
ncbi:capsule biosynthesis protein [Novosphingobium sp. AAP83]|uniref:capsular polysaccharide export protein, LipB/KpsS family n=1 Tax=Novosphingobium sp. AAP83 TaxID=1523425 RepID=UPI0006B9287A|nr:capsule biosynthesis protein [Novosphingobium sp. AAP83]KPF90541.1 capsule biosynthesis protein [Novosphingobium sp. AAP83]